LVQRGDGTLTRIRETLKQIDYDFLSIQFLFFGEFELPQNVTG
jgi:hypothetical protein